MINKAVSLKAKIPKIEMGTILSTFEGHTIFSLYYDDIDVYQQLKNQICEEEFLHEKYNIKHISNHPVENRLLRRLIQILLLPTITLASKKIQKLYFSGPRAPK